MTTSIADFLALKDGHEVRLMKKTFVVKGYEEIDGRREPILVDQDGQRLYAALYALHLMTLPSYEDDVAIHSGVVDVGHDTSPKTIAVTSPSSISSKPLELPSPEDIGHTPHDAELVPELYQVRPLYPSHQDYLMAFARFRSECERLTETQCHKDQGLLLILSTPPADVKSKLSLEGNR